MLDLLRDKTLDEAHILKEKFLRMIQTGETAPELDEVNALADISKMPARVKCAELAWQILDWLSVVNIHRDIDFVFWKYIM